MSKYYNNNTIFDIDMRTEAWFYFKNLGFNFYIVQSQNNSNTYFYAINNQKDFEKLISKSKDNQVVLCEDIENYLLHFFNDYYKSSNKPYFLLDDKRENQKNHYAFFKHFFTKFPKHQKSLLGAANLFYVDESIENYDFIYNIVDLVSINNNDKLTILNKFPISFLTLAYSIDKIDKYLTTNKLEYNDIDTFLIKYLKARAVELKKPKVANEVKEFLLYKYQGQENKLRPYFDFFPPIKIMFEKTEKNYILNEESLATVLVFNTKKMKESFLMDQWELYHYKHALDFIIKGCQEYFKFSNYSILEIDKTDKTYQLTIFHDDPTFTKEVVNQIIIEYFDFIHGNIGYPNDIEPSKVLKWLEQKDLHKKLNNLIVDDNIKPTKKRKI